MSAHELTRRSFWIADLPGSKTINVVVLLSGSGTTFDAIRRHSQHGAHFAITHVVSDNPSAYGLTRAAEASIANRCVPYRDFKQRADFDQALLHCVEKLNPDLVVLAGFMRIVDSNFVRAFSGRLLNIHPSLLPKYPGLNTYARALVNKERTHGSSVHFVNDLLDGGPVISQVIVNINNNDTVETLSARVQQAERKLYPVVIDWFASGRLEQRDDQAWMDGLCLSEPVRFHYDFKAGELNAKNT